MNDRDLLQAFARQKSEAAFAALVRRHGKLVYSCARQRVGDPHAAEDITQSVFLALAIKAAKLPADVVLSGWLYRATQFAAVKYHRREHHRQEREMRASEHQQILGTTDDSAALWQEISPYLAAALDGLSAADRDAVLLRFYEQADYGEIAGTLRVSADAARKRVDRALEQLRRFFTKKGVGLGTGALATVLSARAAEAIPATLVSQTVQTAVAGVTGTMAATETLMLAKGALHAMFIAKVKTVSLAAAACFVVAGTSVVVAKQLNLPSENPPPATVTSATHGTVTMSARQPVQPATPTPASVMELAESGAPPVPATVAPTGRTAERVARLKANLETFELDVWPHLTKQDHSKPFYELKVGVHESVLWVDRSNSSIQQARISKEQAAKIVDYLAQEGFLERAEQIAPAEPGKRAYREGYVMQVFVNPAKGEGFEEQLGWNLAMLQRLDGLRQILEGDAAKAMDRLLGRMSGLRQEWGGTPPNPSPATTAQPDEGVQPPSVPAPPAAITAAEQAEIERLQQYYPHGFNFVDTIRADGKILWKSKRVVDGRVAARETVADSVEAFLAAFVAANPDQETAVEVHVRPVKIPGATERAHQILQALRDRGYSKAGGVSD